MADYKEGIVESIKIATLKKQIEILEKLGLSKDEILEKMSDENADMLTIILNKIDGLYEQEEQALVEQLARTLLANQSEASVKYVLEHELIGKVFKYILKSDNNDFDDKTISQIMSIKELFDEVYSSKALFEVLRDSSYWVGITRAHSIDIILNNREYVGKIIEYDSLIRDIVTTSSYLVEKILMRYGHAFHTHDVNTSGGPYPDIRSNKLCIAPLTWFMARDDRPSTYVIGKDDTYSIEKRPKQREWSLTLFHKEYPHAFTEGYVRGAKMTPGSYSLDGGFGVFLKNESDLANVNMRNGTEVMTYAEFKSKYPEIA